MANWLNILIRSLSLVVISFIIMRLFGKKNISKVSAFSYIYFTVIALIAALISVNVIENVALGFLALGIWFVVPFMLELLAVKSKAIHDIIYGKEIVLIKQGKVMEENLIQARMTADELLKDLRMKNAFNLADVEFAVLEQNGDVNVLMKADSKPVTSRDMGMNPAQKSEPQTVVMDGNVIYESLSNMGLDHQWLNQELEGLGVSLDNIFIAQVDSSGDLYVDLFDDSLMVSKANLKDMLYANLEKAQSELTIYKSQTEDKSAKEMYKNNADKLDKILKRIKPYLLQ